MSHTDHPTIPIASGTVRGAKGTYDAAAQLQAADALRPTTFVSEIEDATPTYIAIMMGGQTLKNFLASL